VLDNFRISRKCSGALIYRVTKNFEIRAIASEGISRRWTPLHQKISLCPSHGTCGARRLASRARPASGAE
jgi:hypothetical protein